MSNSTSGSGGAPPPFLPSTTEADGNNNRSYSSLTNYPSSPTRAAAGGAGSIISSPNKNRPILSNLEIRISTLEESNTILKKELDNEIFKRTQLENICEELNEQIDALWYQLELEKQERNDILSNQNEFEQRILQSVIHVLNGNGQQGGSGSGEGNGTAGNGNAGTAVGAIIGDFNTQSLADMKAAAIVKESKIKTKQEEEQLQQYLREKEVKRKLAIRGKANNKEKTRTRRLLQLGRKNKDGCEEDDETASTSQRSLGSNFSLRGRQQQQAQKSKSPSKKKKKKKASGGDSSNRDEDDDGDDDEYDYDGDTSFIYSPQALANMKAAAIAKVKLEQEQQKQISDSMIVVGSVSSATDGGSNQDGDVPIHEAFSQNSDHLNKKTNFFSAKWMASRFSCID